MRSALPLLRPTLIAAGLLATITSTLRTVPQHLAYYNELPGGPGNGHKHLLGSRLDWGQDLLYLKSWLNQNPHATPFHLGFYANFNPADLGVASEAFAPSATSDCTTDKVHCVAMSRSYVEGFRSRAPAINYEILETVSPTKTVGMSLLIYELPCCVFTGLSRNIKE